MDFNNHVRYVFVAKNGFTLWITESVINMWIIMAVLIAFAIIARLQLKKFNDVPKGFQNIIEMMIEFFDNFVTSTAGPKLRGLSNWYFMVFAFVLCSNLSGMFGLRPPTADWTVTVALAVSTFVLIQVMGIRFRGVAYLKSFIEPFFVFFPLNLIGEIARPIALSFRLFGNMLSGLILMGVIYALVPWFVRIGIPAPLHAYFDVFVGCIQAYIFTILSIAFIGAAAEDAPA